MRRVIISIIILTAITLPISAEDAVKYKSDDELIITDNSIIYNNLMGYIGIPEQIKIDNYTIEAVNKIPFVLNANNEKEILLLKNDEIAVAYSSHSKQVLFLGIKKELFKKEGLVSPWDVTATSFLTEGKTVYLPENVSRLFLEQPWVEGVSGQGNGEKINFSMGSFKGIYIFNGFISFWRSDLYLKNSRIKSIIVRDLNTGFEKSMELLDTPNPQLIDYSEGIGHKIEIEIIDVYPGTKYEDTCLAGILLKGF